MEHEGGSTDSKISYNSASMEIDKKPVIKKFSSLHLVIIVVSLTLALLLSIYFLFTSREEKQEVNLVSPPPQRNVVPTPSQLPTPEVTPPVIPVVPLSEPIDTNIWNIYSNEEYHFTLQYPKIGLKENPDCLTQGVDCDIPIIGDCGEHIGWSEYGGDYIAVDSFFAIFIDVWTGTLDAYIADSDPLGVRNYKTLEHPTADGVVEVLSGYNEVAYDKYLEETGYAYPPFSYAKYIIKNNDTIFTLNGFQNISKGCWKTTDDMVWDIPSSFRFTQ